MEDLTSNHQENEAKLSGMSRKIVEILPSYYFPCSAKIIITDCGHRHIRHVSMEVKIGDEFWCGYDHEETVVV